MIEVPHPLRSLPAALLFLAIAAAPSAAQDDPPAPLRFAWPVPCKFAVDVKTRKAGRTVKVRHFIRLSANLKRKDELLLRFVKTEPLEMNGVNLKTPKARADLGPDLARLRGIYPDLRLSRQGELLGVRGLEDSVDRWLQVMRDADPTVDEEKLAAARKRTLSPDNRSALEAKVTEFWKVWVGAWRGMTLKEGEQATGVTTIPIGRENVEASTVLHHQGDSEGDLLLSLQIELRGEKARKAFQSFLRDQSPKMKPEVQVFSRSTRFEVLTKPDTLQPRLVAVEQVVTLKMRGEKEIIRRESQEYTFHWAPRRRDEGKRRARR